VRPPKARHRRNNKIIVSDEWSGALRVAERGKNGTQPLAALSVDVGRGDFGLVSGCNYDVDAVQMAPLNMPLSPNPKQSTCGFIG
jgi:hypothetical protein